MKLTKANYDYIMNTHPEASTNDIDACEAIVSPLIDVRVWR